MGLNERFIDGQITCPEPGCGKAFFDRGEIGGKLRWVYSHDGCKGAGARVPLEPLTDSGAKEQCEQYYRFLAILPRLELFEPCL